MSHQGSGFDRAGSEGDQIRRNAEHVDIVACIIGKQPFEHLEIVRGDFREQRRSGIAGLAGPQIRPGDADALAGVTNSHGVSFSPIDLSVARWRDMVDLPPKDKFHRGFPEGRPMKNMIDYIRDTGSFGFDEKPFCAADSIVLAQLAYLQFGSELTALEKPRAAVRLAECIPLRGIRALVDGTFMPARNEKLLLTILESSRFKEIRAYAHVAELDPQTQKQFSATTFLLPTGVHYVAFRGTDATLVGWKEDLNMAFLPMVPAQASAVAYLDGIAKLASGLLMVGGHSKGGNLALYAALKSAPDTRKRLRSIFNHDGPGFREDLLSDQVYQSLLGMVQTSVPRNSIVGMLLQHDSRYRVVECASIGLFQHDMYTWGIENGDLQYAGTLSTSSMVFAKSLETWLLKVDTSRRERFVDVLTQVLDATRLETVDELPKNWRKAAQDALKAIKDIDEETRGFIQEIFQLFLSAVKENVKEEVQQKIADILPTSAKA